jgi:hypothetical protein
MMARTAPPAGATCWMLSHPAVRLPRRSCWYPRIQPLGPSGPVFHIHTVQCASAAQKTLRTLRTAAGIAYWHPAAPVFHTPCTLL